MRDFKKQTVFTAAFSVFFYTCVLFCELTGLKTTPTGIAAFLENLAIVFVPLIESVIFRKKAGFKTWFCGAAGSNLLERKIYGKLTDWGRMYTGKFDFGIG